MIQRCFCVFRSSAGHLCVVMEHFDHPPKACLQSPFLSLQQPLLCFIPLDLPIPGISYQRNNCI